MWVTAGVLFLVALVAILGLRAMARPKPKQLGTPEDDNLFLLAEKEVEALLAKEGERPDAIPFEMLNRKFKHVRESEVVWVTKDSLHATITGHIFVEPTARIYKSDHSSYWTPYCKVIVHNGETMIEIPDKVNFDVKEDSDVDGWIRFTLVTVVHRKPISGQHCPY